MFITDELKDSFTLEHYMWICGLPFFFSIRRVSYMVNTSFESIMPSVDRGLMLSIITVVRVIEKSKNNMRNETNMYVVESECIHLNTSGIIKPFTKAPSETSKEPMAKAK